MSISVSEALKPFLLPVLIVLIAILGFIFGTWLQARYFAGDTPVQPIEFSHRVHVEDNRIPCMHCHVQAEHTPVAGVPPVSKCMSCHKVIARDRPEIIRLAKYWENRQPIPWVKVYDVPDFVHFTHQRHIQAGLECQACHGPVESMDRITRVVQTRLGSPRMAWCVECHTAHEDAFEHGRGLDCWTCHK